MASLLVGHPVAQAEALVEHIKGLDVVMEAGVDLAEARGYQGPRLRVSFKPEAVGADKFLEGNVVAVLQGCLPFQ